MIAECVSIPKSFLKRFGWTMTDIAREENAAMIFLSGVIVNHFSRDILHFRVHRALAVPLALAA